LLLLTLKLFLVPAFLAAISFAGKRWGPGIAGWLVGFPTVTGPVLLILALEQGLNFTASAAALSMWAGASAILFVIAYAWAATRFAWASALLIAYGVWFAVLPIFSRMPPSPTLALAVSVALLILAPRALPRPRGPVHSHPLPGHELLLRMAVGASMVLAVTGAAEMLGPAWTGYFASFPVMTSLMTVFSHRANGSAFVILLLRAMVGGFYSYVAYCYVIATTLESLGFGAGFVAAIGAALLVQGAAKALMMRLERGGRPG
jgi:hypothetical protein